MRVLELDALAATRGDAPAIIDATGTVTYSALAARVAARAAEIGAAGPRALLRCRRDLATIVDALALLSLERAVLPHSDAATHTEIDALEATFDAAPRDAALALPSSGSTGAPKLVLKSAEQIRASTEIFARSVALDDADRVLALVPFEHAYGFVCVMLGTLARGATLVLPASDDPRHPPHPRAILETIRRERVTLFPASPQFFDLLARFEAAGVARAASNSAVLDADVRQSDRPSAGAAPLPLRAAISVGAALPRRVHASFTALFDVPLWQSYGASEAGPVCLNTRGDAGGEFLALGTPCDGVDVSIRALDAEDPVGEIVVRSPAVGIGYAGPDGVVASVGESRIEGGRFFTGDLGGREGDTIFFAGRRKLFIAVSGRKVDPHEVEEALRAHPRIADAAVVAHADGGREIVKALVVPRGPLDPIDAIDHCARRLAAHKVPRVIELRDALPRNELGKLQREQL